MVSSGFVHVAANGIISFFMPVVVFHCTYVPHVLYAFLCRWTFRLLLCLGYWKQCCSEHDGGHVSFQIMVFSRYMPTSGIAGSYGNSPFSFLRTSILFSIVAIPIFIPTNSVEGLPFLHTLSSIYSVQFSCSIVSHSLRPHESQHARPPCPSPTAGVYSNSCPSSRWCHPAISSSVIPFSSCPQPLPALGSFPMSQLFTWGGQSIGVSASASVRPMNTQDWSPLGMDWLDLLAFINCRLFSDILSDQCEIIPHCGFDLHFSNN